MEIEKKICDYNNSWSYKWGVIWMLSLKERGGKYRGIISSKVI